MAKPGIRAKIAAVTTPTSVVINRGRNDGVTGGMKFAVYYALGPLTDPDDPTNVITELTFRKGTITVARVYDRMAFCSIEPTYTPTGLTGLHPAFSFTEAQYPDVERPMFAKEDRVIRVGDTVEQIFEEPTKERPSIEALWTVEFETKSGLTNSGILVLEGGRIFGGDSGYYYVGKYTFSGETLSGDVQVTHYHGPAETAFGEKAATFSLTVSGKLSANGNQITGTATRGLGQVQFRMTKRAQRP